MVSGMSSAPARVAGALRRANRWGVLEILLWILAVAAWFFLPEQHLILAEIVNFAILALSLDLILGYAGIVSLGHAAFFGVGAYAAGLIAKHYWTEPLSGLLFAAVLSGIVGYALSHVVVRFRHLALIMLTMGFGLLLHEMLAGMRPFGGSTMIEVGILPSTENASVPRSIQNRL